MKTNNNSSKNGRRGSIVHHIKTNLVVWFPFLKNSKSMSRNFDLIIFDFWTTLTTLNVTAVFYVFLPYFHSILFFSPTFC